MGSIVWQNRAFAAVATGLGALLFLYRFGFTPLDVTDINWLMEGGDPATHYLGWLFYRNEPYSFPLGDISKLLAPIGTNIGLTDSNPLLAIPLKLVSAWLPRDFQYVGWWLFSCYCLQGCFAYYLTSTITDRGGLRLLGVALFLLSPPLLWRTGHATLCAHWLILACHTFYFMDRGEWSHRKRVFIWSFLVAVSSLIHPYMMVIVIVFAIGASFCWYVLSGNAQYIRFIGTSGWYPVLAFGILWGIGYFSHGTLRDLGGEFGHYSMNLNAFWNSLGRSFFLPALPLRGGQYEGFNYLGLGILVLVAGCVPILVRRLPGLEVPKHVWTLLVIVTIFFLFAVSNKVAYGGEILLEVKLPDILRKFLAPFQSSGRYGWVVFYGILCLLMWYVAGVKRQSVSLMILAGCLVIQGVDLHEGLVRRFAHAEPKGESLLKADFWNEAAARVEKITVVPAYRRTIRSYDDYRFFCLLAGRNRLAVNLGYVARVPWKTFQQHKEQLIRDVSLCDFDRNTMYVFQDRYWCVAAQLIRMGFSCHRVDGYGACVSSERSPDQRENPLCDSCIRRVELIDFLRLYKENTILMAVRDDAVQGFPDDVRQYLVANGSAIGSLGYRDSYAGILAKGRRCFERMSKTDAVEVKFPRGGHLCHGKLSKAIEIFSAGLTTGNRASIKVGGTEYSLNGRGINLVVLDQRTNPVAMGHFDTHAMGQGLEILAPDLE